MNERRILTKEDVKSFAYEFTGSTTDVIEYLYIPADVSINIGSLNFYCVNNSGNRAQFGSVKNSNGVIIPSSGSSYYVSLTKGHIRFNMLEYSISRTTSSFYSDLYYSELWRDSGASTYNTGENNRVNRCFSGGYLEIHIPSINIYCSHLASGQNALTGFYFKYSSGTIAEDTVFYLPYSA